MPGDRSDLRLSPCPHVPRHFRGCLRLRRFGARFAPGCLVRQRRCRLVLAAYSESRELPGDLGTWGRFGGTLQGLRSLIAEARLGRASAVWRSEARQSRLGSSRRVSARRGQARQSRRGVVYHGAAQPGAFRLGRQGRQGGGMSAVQGIPLPPFDPSSICGKCSGEAISVVWHPGAVLDADARWPCGGFDPASRVPGEHLCRRCSACGYAWAEQVADAYADQERQPEEALCPSASRRLPA
jgi:hypothetical protein